MSFPVLNNVTTADGYTDANTVECPGAVFARISIANAAIYYQRRDPADAPEGMSGRSIPWSAESFVEPSYLPIRGRLDGIRVRSAVAGTPAQVTVEPR